MPSDEERAASPAPGLQASPAAPALGSAAVAPTSAPAGAAAASPAASSGQNAAPSEEKPAEQRGSSPAAAPSPEQNSQTAPGSALHPPGSFSSSPVAPVVASNHQRRWRHELGWIKPDGRREDETAAAAAAASSPTRPEQATPAAGAAASEASGASSSSSSETSEEDIRAPKPKTPEETEERDEQQASSPPPVVDEKQEESNQKEHLRVMRARAEEEMRRADYEASKAMVYAEDRRTPSPVDRDFRIMFKDRQVFADDLIGLRVAKTFAGHGRFLGQVVKFDGPTGMYTVVYADGDAEDLNVDSTIEILIQDEIERVDPTLPPPATSLFFKREAPSSVSGDEPMEPATSGQYASPRDYVRPDLQRSLSSASNQGYRSAIRITDREAQFVIGLFESHALPILLQQGWRVQTIPSGGESRYVAPGVSDGFSGSGAVFRSALDVVEYIASDDELLAACFPSNVHAAILSLLPDSRRRQNNESAPSTMGTNMRKRGVSEVPGEEAFGSKRHRQPREDMYRGVPPDMRRVPPTVVSPRSERSMGGRGYRPVDIGYRPRERSVAPEQYPAEGGRTAAPLMGPRQPYYASMEYSARHSRHLSDSSSSSRWSNEHGAHVSDKPIYQRRYEESPRWHGRDVREQYPPSYAAQEAGQRAYPRAADRYYPADRGMERPTHRGPRSTGSAIAVDYRYSDRQEALGNNQPSVTGSAYAHRYGDRVESRQLGAGVESITARLPRDAAIYSGGDGRVRMDNPGISMMDVERLAGPRSGGRVEQPAGRSPHDAVDSSAYASFRRHYASQRSGDSRYVFDAEGTKPATTPDTPSESQFAQSEQRVT